MMVDIRSIIAFSAILLTAGVYARTPPEVAGWLSTGNASTYYDLKLDTSVKRTGTSSASISLKERGVEHPDPFFALVQMVDAERYKGKRVMLSGWLRSDAATKAGLWMRVHTKNHMVAFDNMLDRSVKGTTAWQRYEIVLDVPKNAVYIALGALLAGHGKIWIDDLEMTSVTREVAPTNMLKVAKKVDTDMRELPLLNARPFNMNFEERSLDTLEATDKKSKQ